MERTGSVARGKIDDENSTRPNRSKKSVIREGFVCFKCGHKKAFFKSGHYQCTACKYEQLEKVI